MKRRLTENDICFDCGGPRLPSDVGICAMDYDECTVTLALNDEKQVRALLKVLPAKSRVRVVQ